MKISDDMMEAIRRLHSERGGDMTWFDIVSTNDIDLSPDALRRRVTAYEKRRYGVSRPEQHGISVPQISSDNPFLEAEVIEINHGQTTVIGSGFDVNPDMYRMQMEIRRLKHIIEAMGHNLDEEELMYDPYPYYLDDTQEWEEWQMEFATKQKVARVMVWSDIHIPDESTEALEVAFKLAEIIQPDIILFNGDIFDFDALSTFAKKRFRRSTDAIKEVEMRWHAIIDRLKEICPDTILVAYRGNHDDRIERWNTLANNPFAESTEEMFVEMVRSNSRVLWLGQNQETHVGAWYVQHGKRVGDNAAKNSLKDLGWATAHGQGHAHTISNWVHRVNDANNLGNYRVVMSACSGALCNIPPHYITDTKMSKWLHGLMVGHVWMDTNDVNIQNLVFHRRNDGTLWTVFGNEIVTSEKTA